MIGTLSGYVLGVRRSGSAVELRLAGICSAGRVPLHFILPVFFKGERAKVLTVREGDTVKVSCVATYEQFSGRGGEAASRVRVLGVQAQRHNGPLARHGSVTYLLEATNEFTFSGFLVRSALRKVAVGVTEARVAVVDRRGERHYFNLEAWREVGESLSGLSRGAEGHFRCMLRRDHAQVNGIKCSFDVMEVVSFQRKALVTPFTPVQVAAD